MKKSSLLLSMLTFANKICKLGLTPQKSNIVGETVQTAKNNLKDNANQQKFLDWYDEYAYTG